jgi:hypothetical protein
LQKTQQETFYFMRRFIFTAFAIVVIAAANAQSKSANSSSYKTALGVKVWDGGGVSLKHFFNSQNAGELIAYFWRHGMRVTGLFEIHGNISGAPGLKWYIGPGAHIGFYDRGYIHRGYYYPDTRTLIGIDGVLGLDYKFKGAPINISLDWQPAFEFGDYAGFYGNWGGLGIRYTF